MKAIWTDHFWCSLAEEELVTVKEEVDILQFGVGIFGSKAVIKKKNGLIETVYQDSLELIDDEE